MRQMLYEMEQSFIEFIAVRLLVVVFAAGGIICLLAGLVTDDPHLVGLGISLAFIAGLFERGRRQDERIKNKDRRIL